jgi:hypothetical protein
LLSRFSLSYSRDHELEHGARAKRVGRKLGLEALQFTSIDSIQALVACTGVELSPGPGDGGSAPTGRADPLLRLTYRQLVLRAFIAEPIRAIGQASQEPSSVQVYRS